MALGEGGEMTIALYDVDSKIPNLALMKLSRYHKERGDEVVPFLPIEKFTYDKVYASTIFNFSDKSYLDPEQMSIGGTGWDFTTSLPDEVEGLVPDYTFYDCNHSIGFSMRGCRFKCEFCVVPKKEGRPVGMSTIDQLWTQRDSNFLMLLDNDFFGNPEWQARIDEMLKFDLRVNFSQGLNIRIISKAQAEALASVRFVSASNKSRAVFFAWDQIDDERVIIRGMERCVEAGIKPHEMQFYVLIGFNSTHEENMRRVTFLNDFGADPFVMPFDRSDPYQRRFARWVNHKATFNTVTWEEYK
jgi:hypothetical protein